MEQDLEMKPGELDALLQPWAKELRMEYELTLSLGDGLRPGCIEDASDRAKYMEFIMLGELVKRDRKSTRLNSSHCDWTTLSRMPSSA
jgi:hypothetical protein